MEYPKLLHANVLLLDGEIINWKTGSTSWENEKWVNSRQPLDIVVECALSKPERLQSETFSINVQDEQSAAVFWRKTSKEFYKMFPVSERMPKSFFDPYV